VLLKLLYMKKFMTLCTALVLAGSALFSQEKNLATNTMAFMQITTIESVVSAGIGRSKMIVTKEDGSQEEKELNNLFSISGINFKNVKENETTLITTLKSYTEKGWKLVSATPLTLSPNESGNGIFMTRYLLTKS
jgi:hypothetical protein